MRSSKVGYTARDQDRCARSLACCAIALLAAAVTAAPSAHGSAAPIAPGALAPIAVGAGAPVEVGASAPGTEVRDLAALLRPIRERHDVPALAAAAVSGGETIALGVDGVRKRGAPERVEVGDRWHLGSCTKSMTATWIATFVEEEKLDWSTAIGAVFAERVADMDPAWKAVTIEELLCHRAGAPANLDAEGLWLRLWNLTSSPPEQRLVLVDGVLCRPPVAPPGTKYIYSNAGYAVAAAATEKILGIDWESSIRARLFEPLGMESAGFGAPGTPGKLDEPRGHTIRGEPIEVGRGDDNPSAIAPAGKVHASIGDWAKYVALHLAAARGEHRLLKPETWKRLHAPFEGQGKPYGFGWIFAERAWAGGRTLSHAGSNTMWYCVAWIAPEKDFAAIAATNQGGDRAAAACDDVVAALIAECLKPVREPASER